METLKKNLVDILVVFGIPALLIWGFYAFQSPDSPVLSMISGIINQNAGGEEVGTKTKEALAVLDTIKLNESLFEDPAYKTLKDYPITIPGTTLGRANPFILTPQLAEQMKVKDNAPATPKK